MDNVRSAEPFDFDRLEEVRIENEYDHDHDHVYPYAFWVWRSGNGLKGGMVCFRGECRRSADGDHDVGVIESWMCRYMREVGGIQGLVVDTWEFGGEWHDRLSFLPPGELPDSFRVLYSVLPQHRERALSLWSAERVRDNLDVAMAEMDLYLLSLPSAQTDNMTPREAREAERIRKVIISPVWSSGRDMLTWVAESDDGGEPQVMVWFVSPDERAEADRFVAATKRPATSE